MTNCLWLQLRAERWRAEDDARTLRTQVGRLQWQLGLARGAIGEAVSVLQEYEIAPPPELLRQVPPRPESEAPLAAGDGSTPPVSRSSGAAADEGEQREAEDEAAEGGGGALHVDPRSPRAAVAAIVSDSVLGQEARTPWLRTPDGVPVRIDWLVLAPRVLLVLGAWLGATALVVRTTR